MSKKGKHATDESSVQVAIRVRPFIKEEIARNDECKLILSTPNKQTLEIVEPGFEYRTPQSFVFDRVYWSHNKDHPFFATQNTLYDELGTDMINHALSGYNTCIFAYGQTGSGKSYSVLGDSSDAGRGLLPRVVQGLFESFASDTSITKWSCIVSFMEIYNEQIHDLLAEPKPGAESTLKVQSHPVLGAVVQGLTDISVKTQEQVMEKITQGMQQRVVGATAMNNNSSRSHCIFTFKTAITNEQGVQMVSQTHLVDLAGSERASRTQAQGNRLQEGAAINRSLSVLTRVIQTLAENSGKPKGKAKTQPPFRDSKLTHILKESLCGNSKTVMMAALSPSAADFEETMSTLRFAQSVKKVQLSASANQLKNETEQSLELQLRDELADMKKRLMQERFMRTIAFSKSSKEQEELMREQGIDMKAVGSRLNIPGSVPRGGDITPSVGSEGNSPRASELEETGHAEEDDPHCVARVPIGDGSSVACISIKPAASLAAVGGADDASEFQSDMKAAEALISEARSAFKLGRASTAIAKLRTLMTLDVQDPTQPHICIVFEPKTDEGPGVPEYLSVTELQRRVSWLSSSNQAEEWPSTASGLAMWRAAEAAMRPLAQKRSSSRTSFRTSLMPISEDDAVSQRRRMRRCHTEEVTQLQHQLDDALKQLKDHEEDHLPHHVEALQEKSHTSSREVEVEELKALLAKASAAGQALVQTNTELVNDKDRLMQDLEELRSEALELQTQADILETENQEWKKKFELELKKDDDYEQEDEKQELFEEKEELQYQLDEMNRKNKVLEVQLTRIMTKRRSVAQSGSRLMESSDEEEDEATKQEESDRAVKEAQDKLARVEKVLEDLKREYDEVVEENSTLVKQIEELEDKSGAWAMGGLNEMNALQIHCDELHRHAQQLEAELEEERDTTKILKERSMLAGIEIDRMKSEAAPKWDSSDLILDKDGNIIGRRRKSGGAKDPFAEDPPSMRFPKIAEGDDEDEDEDKSLKRLQSEYEQLKGRVRMMTDADEDVVKRSKSRDLRTAKSMERVRANTEMTEVLGRIETEKQKFQQLESEKMALEEEVQRLRTLESKVKELEEELGEKGEKLTNMEMALEFAKQGARTESNQDDDELLGNDELEERCRELELELATQADKGIELAQELQAAKLRAQELEKQLAKSSTAGAPAPAVAVDAAAMAKLTADLEAAKAKTQSLEAELAKSGSSQQSLLESVAKYESEAAETAARLAQAEKARSQVEEQMKSELKEQMEVVDELKRLQAQFQAEAEAADKAHGADDKKLKSELAEQIATAEDLRTQKATLATAAAAIEARCSALEEGETQWKTELAQQKEIVEQLKSQQATLEASAAAAEGRATALEKAHGQDEDQLKTELAQQLSQVQELKGQQESLEASKTTLESELKAAEVSKSELLEETKRKAAAEEALRADLAKVEAAAAAAETKVAEMEKAHGLDDDELKKQLAQHASSLEQLRAKEASLTTELEAALEAEKAASKQREEKEAALAAAIASTKASGDSLQSELALAKSAEALLQQSLEAAKRELEAAQEALKKEKDQSADVAAAAAAAAATAAAASSVKEQELRAELAQRGQELSADKDLQSQLQAERDRLTEEFARKDAEMSRQAGDMAEQMAALMKSADHEKELEASLKAESSELAKAKAELQELAKGRDEALAMRCKDADDSASELKDSLTKYADLEKTAKATEETLRTELRQQQEDSAKQTQETRQQLVQIGMAADAALEHAQAEYSCSAKKYQTEMAELKAKADSDHEEISKALAARGAELEASTRKLRSSADEIERLNALLAAKQEQIRKEEARREALLE